jgi:hypothetical protein
MERWGGTIQPTMERARGGGRSSMGARWKCGGEEPKAHMVVGSN